MGFELKDTDKGMKNIVKEIEKIKAAFVTVGVHEKAEPYPNGASVALVAATNEFGTNQAGKNKNIIIPERSFLRSTFDKKIKDITSMIEDFKFKILLGELTVKKALGRIGFKFANDVKNTIENFTTPPNAPSTQAAKARARGMSKKGKKSEDISQIGATVAGYNDPLVNTRHMKKSITFEVHE